MNVTVINHPPCPPQITLMREADCSTYKFRTLTTELARLMAYEASRDFEIENTLSTAGAVKSKATALRAKP